MAIEATHDSIGAHGSTSNPAAVHGMDEFVYNDAIVRKFVAATIIWGLVAFSAGLLIALQLAFREFNLGLKWTSFGRLRPTAHKCCNLCVCRKRYIRRGLLLNPASLQDTYVV